MVKTAMQEVCEIFHKLAKADRFLSESRAACTRFGHSYEYKTAALLKI
jgi:hypothetical protein